VKEKMNDFVFTGIMASHCIRDLQSQGLLRSPAVTAEERREQDLYAAVPGSIREGSIQMQRWYRMLFVFENVLRDFLTTRFTEIKGDDWFEACATNPMKTKVKERKEREEKSQWHVGRNQQPLYYLDFGDLGNLIKNNWDVFKDFFDQTWILSRIDEAEKTRNVIAHTNILSSEEGQRLELYLRDVLKQIG
jgi:hypothetical protein